MLSDLSLLLAVTSTFASAEYVGNNTVGSCADVDCPPLSSSDSDSRCHVTNRTYGLIGLKSFSTDISSENLTWTVGTHVYDNVGDDEVEGDQRARIIEKDYYLGTPPSLNLSSGDLPYRGCAVFLYGNAMNSPARNESSECADVVGATCVASLLKDATALLSMGRNGSESTKDACMRVQRGLNETFADGCSNVAGQDSWDGVSAIRKST